ncbi:helix-turn-helix transcriptional regulator [Paraburkholderia bannensis]|uniref:helix-turn-helix transcriptional regulator n=1 Tax=Paraburkholderia bannensis TaxID=765414 RepID=UPI002AB00D91|nr:helix-turn-helix transcriptional regulator [Paraburkholderia bannensis]
MHSSPASDARGSLIDAIYDVAMGARLWPEVLACIAARIGAAHVNLSVVPTAAAFGLEQWSGIDAGFAQSYAQHYGALDPLVPQARRWPAGTLVTDAMIRPQTAYRNSAFVQEWVRPQGIQAAAFANVLHEQGDAGVLGVLGVLRDVPRPFEEAELDVLRGLLPHLRNAIRVQRRLQTGDAPGAHVPLAALDAFDALDGLAQAVLIVDRHAQVVFANRAAAAQLVQMQGLRESPHGLQTPSPEATQRLHALIARAAGDGASVRTGGAMLVERAMAGLPLQLLAAPLGARHGVAMLMVIDPLAARRGVEQRLIALYALTPAEARVACEIGNGGNPRDIAAALRIAPSTVRTHLHHVFAKTATRGQADLMRLAAQLAQLTQSRGD